MNTLFEMFRCC